MPIQTVSAAEASALRAQTKATVAGIARFLQETYSQRLTAYIAGIDDPKQVGRWCRDQSAPRYESEERLRIAYQVFKLIESGENFHIARAWMIGMNPQLDDDSPIKAITDARYKEVMAAARSYLQGDL